MPGPTTEVLNEDLKEVKADIRDIRSTLEVLKADVHHTALGLAELRAEVRVTIGVAKWAGALLVTTILTSGVAGIWWASGINARVDGLNARMDEKVGVLTDKINEKSRAIDVRFDRLEAAIAKALEKGRPSPITPKSEDGTNAPEK